MEGPVVGGPFAVVLRPRVAVRGKDERGEIKPRMDTNRHEFGREVRAGLCLSVLEIKGLKVNKAIIFYFREINHGWTQMDTD